MATAATEDPPLFNELNIDTIGQKMSEKLYVLFTGVKHSFAYIIPQFVTYFQETFQREIACVYHADTLNVSEIDCSVEKYASFFEVLYMKNGIPSDTSFDKINVIVNGDNEDIYSLQTILLCSHFPGKNLLNVTAYPEPTVTRLSVIASKAPGAQPNHEDGEDQAGSTTPTEATAKKAAEDAYLSNAYVFNAALSGNSAEMNRASLKAKADKAVAYHESLKAMGGVKEEILARAEQDAKYALEAAKQAQTGGVFKPATFSFQHTTTDKFVQAKQSQEALAKNKDVIWATTKFLAGLSEMLETIFSEMREMVVPTIKDKTPGVDFILRVKDFKVCSTVFDDLMKGDVLSDELAESMKGKLNERKIKNQHILDLIDKKRGIGLISPTLTQQPSFNTVMSFLEVFPFVFPFLKNMDASVEELLTPLSNDKQNYNVWNDRVKLAYLYQKRKELYGDIEGGLVQPFLGIKETGAASLAEFARNTDTLGVNSLHLFKTLQDQTNSDVFWKQMFQRYMNIYDLASDEKLQKLLRSFKSDVTDLSDYTYQLVYVPQDTVKVGDVDKILEGGRLILRNEIGDTSLTKLLKHQHGESNDPTLLDAPKESTFEKLINAAAKLIKTNFNKGDKTLHIHHNQFKVLCVHLLALYLANAEFKASETSLNSVMKSLYERFKPYLNDGTNEAPKHWMKDVGNILNRKTQPYRQEGVDSNGQPDQTAAHSLPAGSKHVEQHEEVTEESFINTVSTFISTRQPAAQEVSQPNGTNSDPMDQTIIDVYNAIVKNLLLFMKSVNFTPKASLKTIALATATAGISQAVRRNLVRSPKELYMIPEKYIVPYCYLTADPPQDNGEREKAVQNAIKTHWATHKTDETMKQYAYNVLASLKNEFVVKYNGSKHLYLLDNPLVQLVHSMQSSSDSNLSEAVKDVGKKGMFKDGDIIAYIDGLFKSINIAHGTFYRYTPALRQELSKNLLFYMLFFDGISVASSKSNGWSTLAEALSSFKTKLENDTFRDLNNMYMKFKEHYEAARTGKTEQALKSVENVLRDPSQYVIQYNNIKDDIAATIKNFKQDPTVKNYISLFSWITPKDDLLEFLGFPEELEDDEEQEGQDAKAPSPAGGRQPKTRKGGATRREQVAEGSKKAIGAVGKLFRSMKNAITGGLPAQFEVFFGSNKDLKDDADKLLNGDKAAIILGGKQGSHLNAEVFPAMFKSITSNYPQYQELLGGTGNRDITKFLANPATTETFQNTIRRLENSLLEEPKVIKSTSKETGVGTEGEAAASGKDKTGTIETDTKGSVATTQQQPQPQPQQQPTAITLGSTPRSEPQVCIDASTGNAKTDYAKMMYEKQKQQLEIKIFEYLDDLDEYVKTMKEKGEAWVKDIQSIGEKNHPDVVKAVAEYNALQATTNVKDHRGKFVAMTEKRNMVKEYYTHLLKVIGTKSTNYFLFVKNFYLKSSRQKIKRIKDYVDRYKDVDPASGEYIPKAYPDIVKRFETLTNDLAAINKDYYKALSEFIKDYAGSANLQILEDEVSLKFRIQIEDISTKIHDYDEKLKSFYRLNYGMADLLFDTQFVILYVIKAIRIGFTYLALFLTTKVFTPIYEETVYDKKENPPSLFKYLLIYIGFDLAFNVFIFTVLFLLKFLFKTEENAFAIDNYLFMKYGLDYLISMLYLFAIAMLVAEVIMSKKYFKYKYEGLRAIRAYQDIVFFIAIFIFLFPYFWMF